MRLNKFFLSALVALGLMACNKEENEVKDPNGMADVVISIGGNGLSRAVFTGDANYSTTADIQKMDIYFANSADIIQYVQSFANGTDDANQAWTDLKIGKQVRFCGMKGVSKVYVIANDAQEAMAVGANAKSRVSELEEYGAAKNEGEIAYMGADADLGNLKVDDIEGISEVQVGEKGELYLAAELSIRPVVSRMEIVKLGFQSSGTGEVTIGSTTYTVEWSDYDLDVIGVYMSNVFGQMTPMTAAVSKYFKTPTLATGSILNGKWVADGTTLNAGKVEALCYSNYNTDYDPLFTTPYPAEENGVTYFFDGTATNVCVPFNFFVPFDVTAVGEDIDANPVEFTKPAIHIQFKKPESFNPTLTIKNADGEVVNNPTIEAQIRLEMDYPNTPNGIAFANITDYKLESGTAANMRPGKIYKMNVNVSPFNLTTSPSAQDSYNVIVKVTVVPFAEVNVTPEFDKN